MTAAQFRDHVRGFVGALLENCTDRNGRKPDHITLLFPSDIAVTAVDVVSSVDTERTIDALEHALDRLRTRQGR